MSTTPVEAIFFWRHNLSAFRAAYGRKPGTTYTKDFLQSGVTQYPSIDAVLKRGAEPGVTIKIRWPSGERDGYWKESPSDHDNRCRLGWETDNAPDPWRVGDPASNPAISIPGNPNLPTAAAADNEYDAISAKGLKPVLLAIKLRGENHVLHARTVLETPNASLKHRGIETLPKVVRDAIISSSKDTGAIILPDGASVRAPELVAQILDALSRDPNVLLIGPPGTGKTVALEDLRAIYEGRISEIRFDPSTWDGAWSEVIPPTSQTKVMSLVFHPSYTYEDFVAGLVPSSSEKGLGLVGRPGPLISMAHWASEKGRRGLLLLDEFNRAHAAAVFGDTLALLDIEKRADIDKGIAGSNVLRPHPNMTMVVADEYKNAKGADVESLLSLPRSLAIVAALNSTDRSVAPLDAALRRRFAIIRVGPDPRALAIRIGTTWPSSEPLTLPDLVADWTLEQVKQLALHLFESLNARIEALLGADFLLGHALLWSVSGANPSALLDSLRREFDERILSTLRWTFADQDDALAAILGIPQPSDAEEADPPFTVARWVKPPAGMESVTGPRLRVQQLRSLPLDQAAKAMLAIAK